MYKSNVHKKFTVYWRRVSYIEFHFVEERVFLLDGSVSDLLADIFLGVGGFKGPVSLFRLIPLLLVFGEDTRKNIQDTYDSPYFPFICKVYSYLYHWQWLSLFV